MRVKVQNSGDRYFFLADYWPPEFTSKLTVAVPAHRRFLKRVMPAGQMLVVFCPEADAALDLAAQYFQEVIKEGFPEDALPMPTANSDDHTLLYVTIDAPKEVVQAAYRALMKLNHPDHGGDAETAVRITDAWKRIQATKNW